jgi:hypothetical protein
MLIRVQVRVARTVTMWMKELRRLHDSRRERVSAIDEVGILLFLGQSKRRLFL